MIDTRNATHPIDSAKLESCPCIPTLLATDPRNCVRRPAAFVVLLALLFAFVSEYRAMVLVQPISLEIDSNCTTHGAEYQNDYFK